MKSEATYGKLEDIDFSSQRHPAIIQLESALIAKRPTNPIHFIKNWAMRQLKEAQISEDEEEKQEKIILKPNKAKKIEEMARRRGAVIMSRQQQTEHWKQFYLKHPLPKNQQCRSRIMLGLRSVPFLFRLKWQDIHHLVEVGEVRQYYRNQQFVNKGQSIDRLFILVAGEIKKVNAQNQITIYSQGSYLFAESLISLFKAKNNFTIVSEKAWICGIEAYTIHQKLKEVNRERQDILERILMNSSLFSVLDGQQMYKLINMVKELPPFKADEIVFQKDQLVQKLFLVMKGQFCLCRLNLSGQIAAFQNYKEGQFFGEDFLKAKTISEYSVLAKTDGILNYIQRESIQNGISKIDHLILRKKFKNNQR